MAVFGWIIRGLVVAIPVYYAYRAGLAIAVTRAVRAGDEERAQRLRERQARFLGRHRAFLLALVPLTDLAVVALVVVEIATQ